MVFQSPRHWGRFCGIPNTVVKEEEERKIEVVGEGRKHSPHLVLERSGDAAVGQRRPGQSEHPAEVDPRDRVPLDEFEQKEPPHAREPRGLEEADPQVEREEQPRKPGEDRSGDDDAVVEDRHVPAGLRDQPDVAGLAGPQVGEKHSHESAPDENEPDDVKELHCQVAHPEPPAQSEPLSARHPPRPSLGRPSP